MKISIDEIKFIKELYPRFELDNETVNAYRNAIDKLPPITISRNKILIDGYHRLTAYRLEGRKEIEAKIFDSENEDEIFIEAIKANTKHGKQLSIKEKRNLAKDLYKKMVRLNGASKVKQQDIANILSVSQGTISHWLSDVIEKEKEAEAQEILELYLNCYSQGEIAEKKGLSEATITNKLREAIFNFIKSYKIKDLVSNLQFYNVWRTFGLNEKQLKFPGQLPYDLVENIIYYFTDDPVIEPNLKLSKVVDPMAGSGVVRDVCRNLYRRYLLYDIEPKREDIPIEKNDILKGFPERARGADLVFLDPPYYNLMDNDYPDNEFTESYESFKESMGIVFDNCKEILKRNGKIALILKPMNEKLFDGEWLDMSFDCANIAIKKGYKIIKRISAPLSTQQFNASDVERAKKSKKLLNIHRDIIIFEKI
ncbi:MAG: hypothetical protein DRP18_05230 [Candidatus Aenigmatarchaeota archaeon]|nr:MAG: hypothetical protein DRP18_05230 [Candidatus Aenigmarchaeota archaeon]